MKLKALNDKVVLIKIKREEQTTDFGLVLSKGYEPVDRARVVAVGPDVKEVVKDMVVLIDWKKATSATVDGIPFYMVKEEDVVAVFDEDVVVEDLE